MMPQCLCDCCSRGNILNKLIFTFWQDFPGTGTQVSCETGLHTWDGTFLQTLRGTGTHSFDGMFTHTSFWSVVHSFRGTFLHFSISVHTLFGTLLQISFGTSTHDWRGTLRHFSIGSSQHCVVNWTDGTKTKENYATNGFSNLILKSYVKI